MSAPPLSPLPYSTPSRAPDSFPLPASSPWSGSPIPSAGEPIPVGKLIHPAWPTLPQAPPAGTPAPFHSQELHPIPAAGAQGFNFPPPPPSTGLFQVVQDQLSAAAQAAPPLQQAPSPAPPVFSAAPADFSPPPAFSAAPTDFSPPPVFTPASGQSPPAPAPPPEPEFTDNDLRDAFAPIFQGFAMQAATAPIDLHLEPMLRATVRRALAEYSPTSGRPFTNPGTWDRFKWRMRALFTSRSYEDILFEKTNRFQVDEVFLLDASTLSLVSYASANPARHASAKRVEGTVHRLALQLRDDNGALRRYIKLPDDRNVIVREGSLILLVAIFRGMPNEMAINDLGYTLSSIEERFADRYHVPGSPLLKLLQPFLEDCLLIQAPASAA